MSELRKAAQQALEALENDVTQRTYAGGVRVCNAAIALRAALAQPEQEPVVWGVDWGINGDQSCCTVIKQHADGTREIVAVEYSPPRREWRGLTDEIIDSVWPSPEGTNSIRALAYAIEAALKEKNHD